MKAYFKETTKLKPLETGTRGIICNMYSEVLVTFLDKYREQKGKTLMHTKPVHARDKPG